MWRHLKSWRFSSHVMSTLCVSVPRHTYLLILALGFFPSCLLHFTFNKELHTIFHVGNQYFGEFYRYLKVIMSHSQREGVLSLPTWHAPLYLLNNIISVFAQEFQLFYRKCFI